jgi:hypothetical protein
LPNEKPAPKELKVTDKRIFTPEGDLREEFKSDIHPSEPQTAPTPPPPSTTPTPEPPPQADRRKEQRPHAEERRRTLADKAENPGTPFTNFIEPLIAQSYMFLGLLRNPYQPESKIDTNAARQMIEILTMLKGKTQGNLEPDEEDFLDTHLGELKLAFVQRTKTI